MEGSIGGPSSVARNLAREFNAMGEAASVFAPRTKDMRLPVGIRQCGMFARLIGQIRESDVVLMLDPVSTGLPAVIAAKLLHKPSVLRIGGDFLWESYVNRTDTPVLLSEFYKHKRTLTLREQLLRIITRFVVRNSTRIVFTTSWQVQIWRSPYKLGEKKTHVVPNAIPEPKGTSATKNILLGSGRDTRIKNLALLRKIWKRIESEYPETSLMLNQLSSEEYSSVMASCIGVIQPSISEVSPNTILEAIAYGKPFVTTRDTGIYEEYKDAGIFIDTRDEKLLEEAIRKLLSTAQGTTGEGVQRTNRTWENTASDFHAIILEAIVPSGAKSLTNPNL